MKRYKHQGGRRIVGMIWDVIGSNRIIFRLRSVVVLYVEIV